MAFSDQFSAPTPQKNKWLPRLLILSLAFNLFGVSWYVSRGFLDSNLPIATAIKNIKTVQEQEKFSEALLIKRLTDRLSEDGAALVFKEYALNKQELDRLIAKVGTLQRQLTLELAKEKVNNQHVADQMTAISDLMSQRLKITTGMFARILPQLSADDRRVAGTFD